MSFLENTLPFLSPYVHLTRKKDPLLTYILAYAVGISGQPMQEQRLHFEYLLASKMTKKKSTYHEQGEPSVETGLLIEKAKKEYDEVLFRLMAISEIFQSPSFNLQNMI